ncbi:MAG TPA: sulfotransferase domain-containing protein [Anaerolineales bacterium]|nr:sulfotransferase domain-containing protein [Anaerolineales bacterium]
MIVLSVGMPRAGSGWHYNLIHDLMQTRGCAEATEIRTRFHLERVLTEVNCNIGVLSPRRLALVSIPALLGNSFVIKAHSRPTSSFRLLRALGLIRATYIYRDPRDAMLSAMNYGERALRQGRPNAFSHLTNFAAAVDFMHLYVGVWDAWTREKTVLIARYEDLLEKYEDEAARLARFLGLNPSARAVREVINRLRPERAEGRQGTHFFRGRIGRFREVFSLEQQNVLAKAFEPFLSRMGYEI